MVGAWFYLGMGNGDLKPYAKNLPFAAYAPKYLPAGFSLDKKSTEALNKGTNIGIPQFNLIFLDPTGKSSIALRQFDRTRFTTDILDAGKIGSFEDYFIRQQKTTLVSRDGINMYIFGSPEKVSSIFGDKSYTAQGFSLKDDSLTQINYAGENKFSEDELIRIFLSLSKI